MTDLEITRLCAEAMKDSCVIDMDFAGTGEPYHISGRRPYDPLHDDAQAMALVKKFDLCVWGNEQHHWRVMGFVRDGTGVFTEPNVWHTDLNRAICECVAKMQQAKALGK